VPELLTNYLSVGKVFEKWLMVTLSRGEGKFYNENDYTILGNVKATDKNVLSKSWI
jgi:hypothetical protein